MRLLLDTHILLWWFADDAKLPDAAKKAISDPGAEIFVSASTAWEIAIKHALGRLDFPVAQFSAIIGEAGFKPLGITFEHAVLAGRLPAHHHDPFDRMLIAQAQHEGLSIVSIDPLIGRYAVAVFGHPLN